MKEWKEKAFSLELILSSAMTPDQVEKLYQNSNQEPGGKSCQSIGDRMMAAHLIFPKQLCASSQGIRSNGPAISQSSPSKLQDLLVTQVTDRGNKSPLQPGDRPEEKKGRENGDPTCP